MVANDNRYDGAIDVKTTTARFIMCLLALITISSGIVVAAQPATANGERPGAGAGPTDVEVFLYLIDIISIDGVSQSFTADLFVMLKWQDPRLASADDSVRRLPLDSVWNPRLQILNQRKLETTFPELVDVEPDGTVTYRQRVYGDFSARLDLHDFPKDRHTIGFRIVVPGYSPEEVRATPSTGESSSLMSSELSVVDWKVGNLSARPDPYEVVPGGRTIAGLTAEFGIQRYLGFYVSKAFLSVAIIVFMGFVVFWVDPGLAGPRMSVAVTAMLTLIAYRFLLGQVLPPLSYLTRMDHFLLGSTLILLAVILQVAMTTNFATTDRAARGVSWNRLSKWVFPLVFMALFVVTFWVS